MDIRTLNDDLLEGGCKGQFYVHQHTQHNQPETRDAVYSVLGICYFSFHEGIQANVQFYDKKGNRLGDDKFIFLGDRLTDRRASPEIADIILASGKAKGE